MTEIQTGYFVNTILQCYHRTTSIYEDVKENVFVPAIQCKPYQNWGGGAIKVNMKHTRSL
jgi:hypothetical protein